MPRKPSKRTAHERLADELLVEFKSASKDAYWQNVYGDALRQNLCLFSKDVLGLEVGPHMLDWGKLVDNHRRIAVNAARDHSKSTFFSYAYPIWRAWGDPGCEIYLFSKTLDSASEFLDIILYGRGNLKGMVDIPELEHLVPKQEDFRSNPRARLNRTDVRLNNGSRIRAVGWGKAVRGRHPKYIVCDDTLNDEDMYSETTRRKNIGYFQSAIVNMATPDGQVIVVGTPYHQSDLYGWLRTNPVYAFKRYPGILKRKDGTEKALFPWRWTLEALKGKKLEIGPVAFTREILCQPVSDDLSIFPSHLFPPLFDENLTLRPSKRQLKERGLTTYMGVDIARSANVGADYFVIWTLGVDKDENHIIVDIRRHKGMAFRDQLAELTMVAKLYDPSLIFIESNAMQQVYTDEMRRTTDLPVKEFVTHATNKNPLDKGIPSLRILLENRKLVIPRGDALSRQLTDVWIEEASQFGFVDGKLQGAGSHDDTVMAWWLASEAKKQGGFSFAIGDEESEATNDWGAPEEGETEENWEEVMIGSEDEDKPARDDEDDDEGPDLTGERELDMAVGTASPLLF